MRCLTLAQELASRGAACSFVTSASTGKVVPALLQSGFTNVVTEAVDDAVSIRSQVARDVDWLIIDDYRLAQRFESACRSWAHQILVIDDLADREHDCDCLLDQTPSRDSNAYLNLVPEHCRQLLGAEYALIRQEFIEHRPASLARQRDAIHRILVSLGGTDPDNATACVLRGIDASCLQQTEVDIVLGAASPNIQNVELLAQSSPLHCRVHVATQKMASLMAAADVAIGAGGTSSLERCCLGLPSILLVLADNQADNARILASAGAAEVVAPVSGSIQAEDIAAALNRLNREPALLTQMSRSSIALCDGNGTKSVADVIMPTQASEVLIQEFQPSS